VSPPAAGAREAPLTVDVLVVAYHSDELLPQCLEEVARFVPDESRILVVDNSPDDPSAAEAVGRIAGAELVPQPLNRGFAAAVNAGIGSGSGELVMLVNPDVVSIVGEFRSIECLFADEDVGAVAPRITNERGDLERCRRNPQRRDLYLIDLGGPAGFVARLLHWSNDPLRRWAHDEVRAVDQANGALLVLRRSALLDVGGLDERFFMYWEEADWLTRAHAKGWRLLFTPEVTAVHLSKRSSTRVEVDHRLLVLESAYKYSTKHFGSAMTLSLRLTWLAADLLKLLRSLGRSESERSRLVARLRLHLGLERRSFG
jgi:hypothetical protein